MLTNLKTQNEHVSRERIQFNKTYQERKNGLNGSISITKVEKNIKLPPIGRKQSRPRTFTGKF